MVQNVKALAGNNFLSVRQFERRFKEFSSTVRTQSGTKRYIHHLVAAFLLYVS